MSNSVRLQSLPRVRAAVTSNTRTFSVTSQQCARGRKSARGNPLRGMSALKGDYVGPWIELSVNPEDVKVPRKIAFRNEKSDASHGLWGFFNEKKLLLSTPKEEAQHGRAWTDEELHRKSFHDLHKIWWACLREQNRILTENFSRAAVKVGYGKREADDRIKEVHKTQKAIRRVLVGRWDAWEDARELAQTDPEVRTDGDKLEYVPLQEKERWKERDEQI